MPLAALLVSAVLSGLLEDPPEVPPLSDADRAAIAAVEELGGQVVQLAQNDARVDVSYHLGDVTLAAGHLDALVPLANRVVGLNLRGTNFDDALAPKLVALPNLRALHLEQTAITDAALAPVGELNRLEYLNLYGTAVTDAGLPSLTGLDSLRSLYVWNTGVTADGVIALRGTLPDADVVGVDLPPAPRKPLVAPKPAVRPDPPPGEPDPPPGEDESADESPAAPPAEEPSPDEPDEEENE